jgi:hypothetical protein
VIGEYWRGLSYETKAALAVLAGVLVVLTGFFAATGVSGLASPASETGAAETLTVKRVVTLTGGGERTVVRTVRVVVPRVTKTSSVLGTAVELRTVTTPGRRDLVTVPGPARTIVETRGGRTRTSVVTNERVVTDRRVVTNERVVTSVRTITNVDTQQVTVPVTTIRTVTATVPVTQTVTTTQVLTQTVVPPAATVTVTVTCPPKGCG